MIGVFPLANYLMVFILSLGVTALLVGTRRYHLSLSSRADDSRAVQAAHKAPTPRIGGIGIALAIVLFLVLGRGQLRVPALLFSLSILPVFAVGLLEDMGIAMRPRYRLAAAAFSSVLVIALVGVHLPRLDLPLVDVAMAFAPFAIVFTIFAATGVCHAMNLIDGLNGLAGGVGMLIAFAMAVVAVLAGDITMAAIALALVPALLGFLVFNFPKGRIFLGDAGAYTLGHVLAWVAIGILWRNPEVSPWAVLLVFFWPVADTLFAIYRRRSQGKPTDQPDRMHFHQLVMRFIEIAFVGKDRRSLANPVSTLVTIPLAAAPAAAGVLLWDDPLLAGIAVFGFAALFVMTYGRAVALSRQRRDVRRFRERVPLLHPSSKRPDRVS